MHRREIVIRSLIREWLLIEQAGEEGARAGKSAASALGGLESLEGQLDTVIEKIENKIGEKSEALVALALGLGLSIPALGKLITKAISIAVKGYVALSSNFSSADQSSKVAWAEKVARAGESFYEKGHHLIEGVYAKVVKILFLLLCAMSDQGGIDSYKSWADSSAGEEVFIRVAKLIDLSVTCCLAVYSVSGAVEAIQAGWKSLAATESVLTAVKGAHIAEASREAINAAFRAFTRAFAEAGVATALITDMVAKAKEFFDAASEAVNAGFDLTKRAATAAGLAISIASAVSSGEGSKSGREDVSQQY